jgi:SAM-dependent methyltransferase
MQGTTIDIARHNADLFDRAEIAEWYGEQSLFASEVMILERFHDAYAGKRLLDLGVGSGRTTGALLPDVANYVGIDKAEAMLAVARRRFPSATFLDMDVRAIGEFGPGRFDFVFGALAILSAFDHAERLAVIEAVHHVLAPGGVFAFSFHNRLWRRAGSMPLHARSWHPREIVNSVHPQSWINYLRLRSFAREEADYAIHVDPAHRWSGLFYFIDLATQERQLEAAGFEIVARFGEDGRPIAARDDTTRDGLLNLVCKKGGAPH